MIASRTSERARAAGDARRTPLVAVGLGVALGLATGARHGVLGSLVLGAFVGALALASAVDVRERRIPNLVTVPGTVLALLAAAAVGHGPEAAGGMAVAGGTMGVAWLLGGGRLGLGDVKLSAFVGTVLGAQAAMTYLLAGTLAGAAGALVVLALTRSAGRTLPYGPYLALGAAVAAALYGPLVR